MNKSKYNTLILFLVLPLSFLSACDRVENKIFGEPSYSYKQCLIDSLKGSHHYTAEEMRSLCTEITGVEEPHYTYTDDGLIPSNEFTICYDKEKAVLAKEGHKDASEFAKLLCKYAPK